jgi:acyl-coenzyme A thioesterase PaaI-like protein
MTGADVPPGYEICAIPDGEFVTTNGPLLVCLTERGPRFAFRAENKHINACGVVHDGTSAVQVLGLTIQRALNTLDLATASLYCDLAASAKPDDPIETEATVPRVTDRPVFVKETITCDQSVLINANALWPG